MVHIMDRPQDMVSELYTGRPLQNNCANQIPLDYFGHIRNNIPQGMGIVNSHGKGVLLVSVSQVMSIGDSYGEEILLVINNSYGDT